jgi:Putative peptidoglycan binding domain
LREALAAANHDFVLSEPASKRTRLRDRLLSFRRHGFGRTARWRRRFLGVLATSFFVVAGAAILLNALAWQKTRHPAPLFSWHTPAIPPKAPKIAETAALPAPRPQPAMESLLSHSKPMEKPAAQKTPAEQRVIATPLKPHDSISQFLEVPSAPKTPAPAPRTASTKAKAAAAAPSKSVLAAQRALVKLGFVLNPDGVARTATRRAIERYERDHRLPVRGDLTPALMRRLSAEAGRQAH